jgi:hypothetical protein
MKKWFKHNKLIIIGAFTGAIGGYLYWKYVGCLSGTCAITSKPMNSTIYFAVIGALVFSLFKKNSKEKNHAESFISKDH